MRTPAIGAALGLLLMLAAPGAVQQADAQGGMLTDAVQSASAIYGETIIFTLEAAAPVEITGARLTVQVANRPEAYQQDIPLTPDQRVGLSQAIAVSSLRLPPVATLSYSWQLDGQDGQVYSTVPAILRYEDTSVPWRWQAAQQGHLVIRTDGTDTALSEEALRIGSAAMRQVSQMLGLTIEEDLHVYIYPDLAALASSLRLHDAQVQDWVAAYALPDQRAALIAVEPGPESYTSLRRDLAHEITHLVIGLAAGANEQAVPGWLNEGLALRSTGEPDPTLAGVLTKAVQSDSLLPLEVLCVSAFSSLPPQDAALAYAQSQSVVGYFLDRYGAAQMRPLIAAYRSGAACSAGVEQAVGVSLATLEAQWLSHVRQSAARTPDSSTGLLPWIAVTLISFGLALLFVAPQPRRWDVEPGPEIELGPQTPPA
ncbi:MAG: hypothetical protein Kow00124_22760 [Anaerolineae bacterium]